MLINKSQLISDTLSYFLIFSTMSVCSLSWHVISISVKVTSRFLLSQINNSGVYIMYLDSSFYFSVIYCSFTLLYILTIEWNLICFS